MDRSSLSPYAPWLRVGTDVLARRQRKYPRIKLCIAGPRSYTNSDATPIRDPRRDELCNLLMSMHVHFYDSHVFSESHGRDYDATVDEAALEQALEEADIIVFMLCDYETTEDALVRIPVATRHNHCDLRKKQVLVWWLAELLDEGHIADGNVGDMDRMGENENILHATKFERVKRILRHWLLGQGM